MGLWRDLNGQLMSWPALLIAIVRYVVAITKGKSDQDLYVFFLKLGIYPHFTIFFNFVGNGFNSPYLLSTVYFKILIPSVEVIQFLILKSNFVSFLKNFDIGSFLKLVVV